MSDEFVCAFRRMNDWRSGPGATQRDISFGISNPVSNPEIIYVLALSFQSLVRLAL